MTLLAEHHTSADGLLGLVACYGPDGEDPILGLTPGRRTRTLRTTVFRERMLQATMNKIFTHNFVLSLEELSDKKLQLDIWIHGLDGQVSSFDEAICEVFGPRMDSWIKHGEMSDELIEGFRDLDRCVSKAIEVDRTVDYAALIEHPVMESLREKAKAVLKLVRESE